LRFLRVFLAIGPKTQEKPRREFLYVERFRSLYRNLMWSVDELRLHFYASIKNQNFNSRQKRLYLECDSFLRIDMVWSVFFIWLLFFRIPYLCGGWSIPPCR